MCKSCKTKKRSKISGIGDMFSSIDWMEKGAQAGGAIGGKVVRAVVVDKIVPMIKKDADTKFENLVSGAIGLLAPELAGMAGVSNPYVMAGIEAAGIVMFADSASSLAVQIGEKVGVSIKGIPGDGDNIGSVTDLAWQIPSVNALDDEDEYDDDDEEGVSGGVFDYDDDNEN